VKAIIVDDEQLAIDFLERQIKKVSNVSIVGKFQYLDIDENLSLLGEIDIVFLDIEMPGINGLQLAENLLEVNQELSIIFVTAFTEYAVQAFELDALDYIIKPVHPSRLKKTLERVEISINQGTEKPLPTESTLRLNVCKELTFELNDEISKVIQWRTSKSKELFLYLLYNQDKTVRKITISLSNICDDEHIQLNLFDQDRIRERKLGYTMDAILEKYGKDALLRAVSFTDAGTALKRSKLVGGHYAE